MFNIIIFNLHAGSYLRMKSEKALENEEKDKKGNTFRLAWGVGIILLQWYTLKK